MQCLKPNKGYYDSNGKHHFGKSPTGHEHEHDLPCGYCETCRRNKAKLRGFKSYATSLTVERSCFLTLTYGKFAPTTPTGQLTLDKTIIPRFLKRLRHQIFDDKLKEIGNGSIKNGRRIFRTWTEEQKQKLHESIKIGITYCGEYGEDLRPHYHLIIYNYDFQKDQFYWRKSKKGYPCYRSPLLETLWPYGHSEIGTVTPASATYVASYIYKKQYGKNAMKYGDKIPEYIVTPKRNFVSGRDFIRKHIDSISHHGYFRTIDGNCIGIDTHTLQWIEKEFPEHALKIKLAKQNFDLQNLNKQQLENWQIVQNSKKQLNPKGYRNDV